MLEVGQTASTSTRAWRWRYGWALQQMPRGFHCVVIKEQVFVVSILNGQHARHQQVLGEVTG